MGMDPSPEERRPGRAMENTVLAVPDGKFFTQLHNGRRKAIMNIAQFYDKVSADASLQQRIMAGANGSVDAVVENAVRIGASMGYQFTLEEARAFGSSLNELPDEMLELVSAGVPCNGGGGNTWNDCSKPN